MNEFVVSELRGGIGNQLFVWAAGHSFAKRTKSIHFVDDSKLPGIESILVEFPINHIAPNHAVRYPITDTFANWNNRWIQSALYKCQRMQEVAGVNTVFLERNIQYDSRIENTRPSKILRGFFQSYKYFDTDREEIKSLLSSDFVFSKFSSDLLDKFSQTGWISVHVRRGDYKNFPETFNLTSARYYKDSLQIAKALRGDLPVLVFSDDTNLAEQVVPSATDYISSDKIKSSVENLLLMSKGSIVIGSNSTFSWWAAYLQNNSDSAIFPRPWYRNKLINYADLVLPTWISIGI
jgi:hypothetical protein